MHTVFTSILSDAKSFDSALVIAIPVAREIDVGIDEGPGVLPPKLVTLIIRPPLFLRISGITALMSLTAPHTFRSKSSSQSTSLTESKCLAIERPALFTSMST